ncbi:MAG: SIS domain-containing protein [Chloroflexota bacterium]
MDEINTQPAAWQNALETIGAQRDALRSLVKRPYGQVLFAGCGSTYYLSLAGSALFQELTGRVSRAFPAGELLLNPGMVFDASPALLVAVSRSGTTTETIKAVQRFKEEKRGQVIVITNYGDSPLAALADVLLAIPQGQEQSVAQTRSFASMYVAAAAFSALSAGREDDLAAMANLPSVGEALLSRYAGLAREMGENLAYDRFYFLGSGARYGLACETSLKMKEMTLTHSEPFHFLEFRHGPMSMVSKSTVVVGLVSQASRAHEMAVLDEMQALGGTILTLGEGGTGSSAGTLLAFDSGLPEAVRGVLYLPALQLLGFYRSLAKGLNPDQPTNLTAVVKLSW